MCVPLIAIAGGAAVLGGAVSAFGQVRAGQAANAQGKYEQAVAEQNRKIELNARDDANNRGNIEQLKHWRKVAQHQGEQRAGLAASGLDLTFGSAFDLQQDTLRTGMEDSWTIGENTRREAGGFEINASNYANQGQAARMKGKAALTAGYLGAASTILGTASQVAGMGKGKGK